MCITVDALAYAQAYFERIENNLERTLAGTAALVQLDASHLDFAVAKLMEATASIRLETSDEFCCDARGAQLSYCSAAHAFFLAHVEDAAVVEEHRSLCKDRFPLASAFLGEEEQEAVYREHVEPLQSAALLLPEETAASG